MLRFEYAFRTRIITGRGNAALSNRRAVKYFNYTLFKLGERLHCKSVAALSLDVLWQHDNCDPSGKLLSAQLGNSQWFFAFRLGFQRLQQWRKSFILALVSMGSKAYSPTSDRHRTVLFNILRCPEKKSTSLPVFKFLYKKIIEIKVDVSVRCWSSCLIHLSKTQSFQLHPHQGSAFQNVERAILDQHRKHIRKTLTAVYKTFK